MKRNESVQIEFAFTSLLLLVAKKLKIQRLRKLTSDNDYIKLDKFVVFDVLGFLLRFRISNK